MTVTVAGCKVGFSDNIQHGIPSHCANCGGVDTRWFPWPGLWLCKGCFISTNSTKLAALKGADNDKI